MVGNLSEKNGQFRSLKIYILITLFLLGAIIIIKIILGF